METWILEEVSNGITRLYAMRLKNHPSADTIQRVIEEWTKSMRRFLGQPIYKLDVPRIREGFDRLVDKCEYWPAPKTLYDQMPGRPVRKTLPLPDIDPGGMERGKAVIRDILTAINEKAEK